MNIRDDIFAPDKSGWNEAWALWVPRPGSFFFLEIRQPSVLNPDCKASSFDCLLHCTRSRPSLPSSLRHAYCTQLFIPLHWMIPEAVEVAPPPPAQCWVVTPHIPMMKNTLPIKLWDGHNYHKRRGGVLEVSRILEIQPRVAFLALSAQINNLDQTLKRTLNHDSPVCLF